MADHTTPLSPRHERFVLEFLKDGNATRAYMRAGYSPHGAQPSASRLLRRPHIEAAIAARRQRIAAALELSVERIGREYARIAFANIDDYIQVEEDGRPRIDLEKASRAQRAGIVEMRVANHSKPQQQVTLKLNKLQALAALTDRMGLFAEQPEPALPSADRARYEQAIAKLAGDWREATIRLIEAEEERDAARAKLAAIAPTPSPREGQGPRTAPREKVPSASEADEGLPGATTESVVVEAPRSPSSALRAPSPRLRGEKENHSNPCAIAAPEATPPWTPLAPDTGRSSETPRATMTNHSNRDPPAMRRVGGAADDRHDAPLERRDPTTAGNPYAIALPAGGLREEASLNPAPRPL